jgi:hypothetical protein
MPRSPSSNAQKAQKAPRLRLVKVVAQPHFVLDDGDTVTETVASPVEIPAKDWPAYATEQFPQAVKDLEAQLASADS